MGVYRFLIQRLRSMIPGNDPSPKSKRSGRAAQTVDWALRCTIISTITALVAVLVGPCVQLQIATHGRHANLIGTLRRDNVESIRSETAKFLAAMTSIRAGWTSLKYVEGGRPGFLKKFEEAKQLRETIGLRLPQNSENGTALLMKMDEVINLSLPKKSDQLEVEGIEHLYSEIRSLAQAIIESELGSMKSESGID